MAIREWHPGQLAVFWAGGLFAEFVLYAVGSEMQGMWILAAFVALPFVLLAVTWIWFGGRKKGDGT